MQAQRAAQRADGLFLATLGLDTNRIFNQSLRAVAIAGRRGDVWLSGHFRVGFLTRKKKGGKRCWDVANTYLIAIYIFVIIQCISLILPREESCGGHRFFSRRVAGVRGVAVAFCRRVPAGRATGHAVMRALMPAQIRHDRESLSAIIEFT